MANLALAAVLLVIGVFLSAAGMQGLNRTLLFWGALNLTASVISMAVAFGVN